MPDPVISVFTKPWTDPLPELADKLAALGVDGVELAVRPGYQVTPETAATGLKGAARILGERGLRILSIASVADEPTIAACGEAGVPLIRIMAPIDIDLGYIGSVTKLQRELDALVPALERHQVAIGVQNHYGFFVGSAVGLLHLLQPFDPRQVCAVLDMAHCAVDGEPVAMAVDILKDRLNGLVNFKSAYHARVSNPEEEAVYAVQMDDPSPRRLLLARLRDAPQPDRLHRHILPARGVQRPAREAAAHGGRCPPLPPEGPRAPEGDPCGPDFSREVGRQRSTRRRREPLSSR